MTDDVSSLRDAPPTPVEISVFVEDGRYVFRTEDALAIYWFDGDELGRSHCDETCTRTWHPVAASKGAATVGAWTVVERADRAAQWAYKGRPTYTFAGDRPGEAKGDGAESRWHIVRP